MLNIGFHDTSCERIVILQEDHLMADIYHDFPVMAPAHRVFEAITSSAGLDNWWSLRSSGEPRVGSVYRLDFGPGYAWQAIVHACIADRHIDWEMTGADADWTGTHVGFRLLPKENRTQVQFYHTGWPEINDHFRTSSFCWAMYLRILKRFIENGETVPYQERLDA
jgi:uncharacterized protein YndB with AHSA1/START domain